MTMHKISTVVKGTSTLSGIGEKRYWLRETLTHKRAHANANKQKILNENVIMILQGLVCLIIVLSEVSNS